MALFMFGAAYAIKRNPVLALALLGLGVNVKLTAVLLLPWCVWTVWRTDRAALSRALAAFTLALTVPIAVASIWYPVVDGIIGIGATLRYNPYYWNVFDSAVFLWNPGWLRSVNAIATYGVLAFMVYQAMRTEGGWARFGGAIAFVALIKVSVLAQFWYFVLFPAFVMPTSPEQGRMDVRWWLVALAPLLEVRSMVELVVGPFGWTEAATYSGVSAFTPFGIR